MVVEEKEKVLVLSQYSSFFFSQSFTRHSCFCIYAKRERESFYIKKGTGTSNTYYVFSDQRRYVVLEALKGFWKEEGCWPYRVLA